MNTFIRGMLRLAAWITSGRERVHTSLAEQRAAICRHCPMNWKHGRRLSTAAFAWVFRFRRTRAHKELGTCMGCGCDLRIKVWVPLTTADKPDPCMVDYCWVRKELE